MWENQITSIAVGAFAGLGSLNELYVRIHGHITGLIAHASFSIGTWIHSPPRRPHSTCCQELCCLNCMSHFLSSPIVSDWVFSSVSNYRFSPGTRVFFCHSYVISTVIILISQHVPGHMRSQHLLHGGLGYAFIPDLFRLR